MPAPRANAELEVVTSLLRAGEVRVLSGAGMSTASGIPDYRGPSSRARRSAPIQFNDYRDRPETRARYWARSDTGWPRMQAREPNAAHRALANLESAGLVKSVITQNVDGLHQRAGSQRVLELHGTLSRVLCLSCGSPETRRAFQHRMLTLNPGWESGPASIAPDGDAEVPASAAAAFLVPTCTVCGGVMKPDVVFFGESVPGPRVEEASGMVEAARVLLVLGSSLTVFSGYRFVKRAAERGIPVATVTGGATRGDDLATVRIDAQLEDTLPRITSALRGWRPPGV